MRKLLNRLLVLLCVSQVLWLVAVCTDIRIHFSPSFTQWVCRKFYPEFDCKTTEVIFVFPNRLQLKNATLTSRYRPGLKLECASLGLVFDPYRLRICFSIKKGVLQPPFIFGHQSDIAPIRDIDTAFTISNRNFSVRYLYGRWGEIFLGAEHLKIARGNNSGNWSAVWPLLNETSKTLKDGFLWGGRHVIEFGCLSCSIQGTRFSNLIGTGFLGDLGWNMQLYTTVDDCPLMQGIWGLSLPRPLRGACHAFIHESASRVFASGNFFSQNSDSPWFARTDMVLEEGRIRNAQLWAQGQGFSMALKADHKRGFTYSSSVCAEIGHTVLAPILSRWPEGRPLVLNQPLRCHVVGDIDCRDWKNPNILPGSFSFEIPTFSYKGVPLEGGSAAGNWDSRSVHVQRVQAAGSGQSVTGTIHYDIASTDYRFLLKGRLDPLLLNEALPPWWKTLWSDFSSARPWTDIDVSNDARTGNTPRLFGYLECEKFRYRFVPVDKLQLYYWAKAPFVAIQFDSFFQNKKTQGWGQWRYEEPDDAYDLYYGLEGKLPLEDALRSLPPMHAAALSFIRGNGLGTITATGTVYGSQSKLAGKDTLKAQIDIPTPFYLWDINVDSGKLTLREQGQHWELREVALALGKGESRVDLDLDNGPTQTVKFSIDLKNVPSERLWDGLPFLKRIKNMDTSESLENPYMGILNAGIKGHGQLDSLTSLDWEGHFFLTEANLGKIHVFGPLSKMLDRTFLNFGSFKFTEASATASMQKGHLQATDIAIKGPMAQMQGSGQWDLKTSQVGMEIDVQLLPKIKLPVFKQIFSLLRPISHGFHASLSGTLEEPQWSTTFNPLRFLEGKKSSAKKK